MTDINSYNVKTLIMMNRMVEILRLDRFASTKSKNSGLLLEKYVIIIIVV